MVHPIAKWAAFAFGVYYSILPHELHEKTFGFGMSHEIHVLIGVALLVAFAVWTIQKK